MDDARVEVIVAHEALHAEAVALVLVAEVARDPRLEAAAEHVVLVAGDQMQRVAHAPEERQRGVGQGLLAGRDESLVRQLAQRARAELGGAEPHRRVDVAQPARRLLHVGLADVGGGTVLTIPLVALGERGGEELLEVVAVDVVAQDLAELREQPPVARDEPGLLHRRAARKIGAGHRHAIVEGAETVTDMQAEIPHHVEQLLREPLHERRQLAVVDHHQVDVRRRVELAAAVAAERDEDVGRRLEVVRGGIRGDEGGERVQDVVDEARVSLHRLLARHPARVHLLEGVESLGERGAEEFETQTAPILRALGARFGATRPAIQRGRHDGHERSVHPPESQNRRGDTVASGRCVPWRPNGRRANVGRRDPGSPLKPAPRGEVYARILLPAIRSA
jgi:hypothetical protein